MKVGNPASGHILSTERIAVVDVLRAFALFGIIINHSAMAFLAGPPPNPLHITFGSLDRIVGELTRLLTFGKFFAIFSFLFGLSFAIQLANAARKGKSFSGRFAWRLIVLLGIGFVHQLFFSGDILMIYAILGLLLIPLQSLKTRTLAIIAVILVLNIPGLVMGIAKVSEPPPTAAQQQANLQSRDQFLQTAERQYRIKQSGTLSELVEMNTTESLKGKFSFQVATGRLWITFGLFLLGLCAGRLDLFRDTETNRQFFRRLLVWGGATAALTTVIAAIYPVNFRLVTPLTLLTNFAFSVQQAALATFYVAGVTLLFWKNPAKGLLSQLAPMGKMGLTTYLMQTVFGLLLFYGIGFGMLGHLGIASCVALGLLFFCVQIFIARWWMARFTLGPVEWVWRSLTYLKLQPNARVQPSAA